jgi:hypothetical protein
MGDWIGHILLRNCLLKHVIEGKLEGTRRRGRRCKQQQQGELKDMRRYWKLRTDTLDRLCGDVGFEEAMDLS